MAPKVARSASMADSSFYDQTFTLVLSNEDKSEL